MNLRIPIAMLVAAAVAFGWEAAAWTAGLYDGWAFKELPQASTLVAQLDSELPADGAYRYPPQAGSAGQTELQSALVRESLSTATEAGPIMLLLIRHEGVDIGHGTTLVKRFVLDFFTAAIVAMVIATAAKFGARLQDRVALAVGLAAFGVCASPMAMWNFLHLPDNYAIALGVDAGVKWLLAGLVCAFIIRPPTKREATA